MDHLQIETSQNVVIDRNVASVGDRIVAYLVDMLIMFAYSMLLLLIFTKIVKNPNEFLIFFAVVPIIFYSILFEFFLHGQTPGKMAMKIKVMRTDGNAPGFLQYFLRWILRLIEGPFFFYGLVPIITISVNGKGQRLGDLAAGTHVVKIGGQIDLRKTIHTAIADDYIRKYDQVNVLSDKDITTIKDVVRYYVKNTNTVQRAKASSVLHATAEAIKKKMGIEPNEEPLPFLKTVVKDYNKYYKDMI